MCGPHRRFAPLLPHTLRRIPQAVGVVTRVLVQTNTCSAILLCFNTAGGRQWCLITFVLPSLRSGKRWADLIVALRLCCLTLCGAYRKRQVLLQLIQPRSLTALYSGGFNTAGGRCCCNFQINFRNGTWHRQVSIPQTVGVVATITSLYMAEVVRQEFQYRKR